MEEKGSKPPPKAASRMPKDVQLAVKLTRNEYRRTVLKYFKSSIRELKTAFQDESKPALELWIISIIIKGIQNSNARDLEAFLARTIGVLKVADKSDPNVDPQEPDSRVTVYIPSNNRDLFPYERGQVIDANYQRETTRDSEVVSTGEIGPTDSPGSGSSDSDG